MRTAPTFKKLHISYIFLGPTRWFTYLIPGTLAFAIVNAVLPVYTQTKQDIYELVFSPEIIVQYILSFIMGFASIYLLCVVFYFIRWNFIQYSFREDQVQYVKGIIFVKNFAVPYPHIHSVVFKQRLLMHLFGFSDAFIRISGGKTNMSIKIPCMTEREIFKLTTWIDGYANVQTRDNVVPAAKIKLSLKELLLSGFASRANYFACIAGYIMLVYNWYEAFKKFFLQAGDAGLQNVINLTIRGHVADVLIAAMIVVPLFCISVSVITYVITLFTYVGFEARRESDFLDVRYGLINRYRHHVQIGRIQSISIDHSMLGNLFKFCYITVGIAETTRDVRSRSKLSFVKKLFRMRFSGRVSFALHPFVKNADVSRVLSKVLPEYDHEPTHHHPVAKAALRRSFTRNGIFKGVGFWLVVAILLIQFASLFIDPETFTSGYSMRVMELATVVLILSRGSLYFYVLAVIVTILQVTAGVLWAKGSYVSYDESCMEVVNAGYARKATRIFRRHVQYGYTLTSPFQRNSKVSTIIWMTPAGVGGTLERLLDVPEEVGKSWEDWIVA